MKKKEFDITEGLVYETPAVDVIDVVSEGVFCESVVYIEDWEEEDESEDIDFE